MHVDVQAHTSLTVASPCAWVLLYFVLLPVKTLKGYYSVDNLQVFHSVQFHFFTELLLHLFASILALLLLLSSSCSSGDKYIHDQLLLV